MHRLNARGGHERSTLEVLTRLARRGWNITLYAFELNDWPSDVAINYNPLPAWHPRVQLIENLWFAFLTRFIVRRPDSLTLTVGCAAGKADVRVLQFLNSAYLEAIRRGEAPLPNTPSIAHRWYQRLYYAWEAWRERRIVGDCEAVIAISERVRGEFTAAAAQGKPKVHVVHHGSDVPPVPKAAGHQAPAPREAKGSGTPTPIVLFVGAMERKGIAKSLAVLARVKDLPWEFWVVGGGDQKRWEAEAQRLGIGERVIFHGVRPSGLFWPGADIFLFPSSYDPFALVVAEAAASAVVPVASLECGAMELWPGRPTWLNLSARDSDERWAECLRRLLSDANLRRSLGTEAKQVFGAWSWTQVTDSYETILRQLIKAG